MYGFLIRFRVTESIYLETLQIIRLVLTISIFMERSPCP